MEWKRHGREGGGSPILWTWRFPAKPKFEELGLEMARSQKLRKSFRGSSYLCDLGQETENSLILCPHPQKKTFPPGLLRALNEIFLIVSSGLQVESIRLCLLLSNLNTSNVMLPFYRGEIWGPGVTISRAPRNTSAFQIWDFFLDSMGAAGKQTPSRAHSRTSSEQGQIRSIPANDFRCGGVAAVGGSTLDFLHLPLISFNIFDFLTLFSHLLWQLVLPDSVVIVKG